MNTERRIAAKIACQGLGSTAAPEHNSIHEYRALTAAGARLATIETLAELPDKWGGRLVLRYCPAGYYQAGSMARYSARPHWSAGWEDRGGVTGGQSFTARADAYARFEAQTAYALDAERVPAGTVGVTWHTCPTCGEALPEPQNDADGIHCPCVHADDYRGEL